MQYSFDSRIRYSEVGEDKNLTLAGMINYFQDCSTFQSEDLGVGLEFAMQMKRAWVIAYWQIDIHRLPVLAERVQIHTSPYEVKGFFGKRCFWMTDQQGEMLAGADSLWVYLNTETGKPEMVDQAYLERYGEGERLPMEVMSRKIRMPKDSRKEAPFQVVQSHLDSNHHVNNGQYVHMAQQYLPTGTRVKRLRVEYKKSALLHDTILPMISTKDDLITVSLCDMEGNPYAVLEFQIDKE